MFQLSPVVFSIPLEVQVNTVLHCRGLSSGKYEPRGLRFDSTLKICQVLLNSGNLLHKRCFAPFPMAITALHSVSTQRGKHLL